ALAVAGGQVGGRGGPYQQPVAGTQPGRRVPGGDGRGPLLELGGAQPAPVGTDEGRGARCVRPPGGPGAGQGAAGDEIGRGTRKPVCPPRVRGSHHVAGDHGAAPGVVLVVPVASASST